VENKIRDMYNITFSVADIPSGDRSILHEWYSSVIEKTYDQLNVADVTRMLIQKMFLELAVPKAIELMEENPFCGQRYDGELLELLFNLDANYLEAYKYEVKKVLSETLDRIDSHEWWYQGEQDEFLELIKSFQRKLQL